MSTKMSKKKSLKLFSLDIKTEGGSWTSYDECVEKVVVIKRTADGLRHVEIITAPETEEDGTK
jgi:hypothetical protein